MRDRGTLGTCGQYGPSGPPKHLNTMNTTKEAAVVVDGLNYTYFYAPNILSRLRCRTTTAQLLYALFKVQTPEWRCRKEPF